jgi:putative endopeptidase
MGIQRCTLFTVGLLLLVACGPQQSGDPRTGNSPATLSTTEPQAATPAASPELGDWGVVLEDRDTAVRPGDNFFRYANGNWIDTVEIPADRSGYGLFNLLAERTDEQVNGIIDNLVASEPARGSLEQKIVDYYRSFMDVDALNGLGIAPLREALANIDGIASLAELTTAFGRASLDSTASPFGFYVDVDRSNSDRHQIELSFGGLSLPDRDYYLQDDPRFLEARTEFVAHVARMLAFAGYENAQGMAETVLDLETAIAEISWPRTERRNFDLTFNPMSFADFKAAYPGFDWDGFFAAGGITGLQDLNVNYPSAMLPAIELVNSRPLEDWKAWLSYQLISNNASLLSEDIDAENFHFYGTVLNGTPEQRERWERAVARVGAMNGLGEALGQLYVAQYFPESSKQQMASLVENLRGALGASIRENDWMDEATRSEALAKLNAFRPKIAYPDEWTDLSPIDIIPGDLMANARTVREFHYWKSINELNQPTNREEWFLSPQTVNAYYNPSFNEIVFPAAILQAPFFDPHADPAVNYGAIGAIIGHEMGHGFDDQGSKFDANGVQRNWWSDASRATFESLAQQLVDQYNTYEPVPGQFVNGELTLGENIGDVGGLSMAYRAYRLSLGGEEPPVIDGFTGDQRFFLGYAQAWKMVRREEALVAQLRSDPHSPEEYRANGGVRNHDAWYEAFDVQPGDALYLPPEERVRIW